MERPRGSVPVDGPPRAPHRQQRRLWAREPSWGQACQALRCSQRHLTVDGPSARCGMMLETRWRAAGPGQCLPPATPRWENPQQFDSLQPCEHPGKKASPRLTASGRVFHGPQWLLLLGGRQLQAEPQWEPAGMRASHPTLGSRHAHASCCPAHTCPAHSVSDAGRRGQHRLARGPGLK